MDSQGENGVVATEKLPLTEANGVIPKQISLDDLLVEHLGEFGRYQRRVYFLNCLLGLYLGIVLFSWTFVGVEMKHRCKLHDGDTDFHGISTTNFTSNSFQTPADPVLASCFRERIVGNDSYQLEACQNGYVWDHSKIISSGTEEWNLVCDRRILKALMQSIFYVGAFIGSLVVGYLADRYGRKPMMILGCFFCGFVTLAGVWSPSASFYAFVHFCHGFCCPCLFQMPLIAAIEMVGPSKRMLAGMLIEFFFSTGIITLGVFAYLIRDWRQLHLLIAVPGFIFCSYYWITPESPRWLLATNQKEKAIVILKRAAKVNGKVIPDELFDRLHVEEEKKGQKSHGYLDLFRTPNLRAQTLISIYCWVIITVLYYGISLNPSSLGGGLYTSFILSGVVEFPALALLIVTLNRCGRKSIQLVAFILTGLGMIAVAVTPLTWSAMLIIEMLVCKSGAVIVFSAVYLHVSEMYPTVIRSTALGLLVTCSRVGGMASPIAAIYLETGSDVTLRNGLLVVLGLLALLAGGLIAFLPETVYRNLPETLEDGENFVKGPTFKDWHVRKPKKPSNEAAANNII